MRKLLLLISLGLILSYKLISQNVVPNSSFEIYSLCPIGQSELYKAVPWFNPSISTPDFYHACSNGMHVPNNGLFFQYAHTGVGYSGIGVWSSAISNTREYIEIELTDSLEPSKQYYISFYVNLINGIQYAISNIGMYISDTAVYLTSNTNFPFVPQIENPSTNFLADTLNWMLISGMYTAHGGEKFILIGNFRDDANTDTLSLYPTLYPYSYYLIDYVTVIDADSVQGINDFEKTDLNIYPNPATDFLTIKTKTSKPLTIAIFDLLGQKKISATFNGDSKIDVGSLAQGVYVYRVYDRDVIIKTGKLLKQ